MLKNFNLPKGIFQDLIISLCSNAKYEQFKEGEIIYKIGEIGERFFVITKGECLVQKPKKRKVMMTKKEFILHVKYIKSLNDKFLLKKHLLSNRKKIQISEYDIPRLMEKINKTNIIRLEIEKKKYQMIFLESLYKKTFKEFIEEIDNKIIPSSVTIEDYKKKLYELIDETEADKEEDEIIFDEEEYQFCLFDYSVINTLKEGDYFGEDGSAPTSRHRNYYLTAGNDVECYSIHNDIYRNDIVNEYQKLKNKEVSFLNDNSIFNQIKKGTFINHYFKFFKKEEYFRGENLFIEMDEINNIYFIKEGRIQVSLFSNLVKLHNYSNQLLNSIPLIKEQFSEEEILPKLFCQPKHYMDVIKKNKNIRLFILSDNDMLGVEEHFFEFKRLYRATVISEKAYVYSLSIAKFKKMVEFEKIFPDYSKYSIVKLTNFIKRLSYVKNESLKYIDKNFKENSVKQELKNRLLRNKESDLKNTAPFKIQEFKEDYHKNLLTPEKQKDINDFDLNIPEYFSDSSINIKPNPKLDKDKEKKEKNKKIKKLTELEVAKEQVNAYYKDHESWNRHYVKKMDLLMNPVGDVFKFYRFCNFENNRISEIKNDLEKIKLNSLENYLPKIQTDSNRQTYMNTFSLEKSFEPLSKNNIQDIKLGSSSRNKSDEKVIKKDSNNLSIDKSSLVNSSTNTILDKDKDKESSEIDYSALKRKHKSTLFMTNLVPSEIRSVNNQNERRLSMIKPKIIFRKSKKNVNIQTSNRNTICESKDKENKERENSKEKDNNVNKDIGNNKERKKVNYRSKSKIQEFSNSSENEKKNKEKSFIIPKNKYSKDFNIKEKSKLPKETKEKENEELDDSKIYNDFETENTKDISNNINKKSENELKSIFSTTEERLLKRKEEEIEEDNNEVNCFYSTNIYLSHANIMKKNKLKRLSNENCNALYLFKRNNKDKEEDLSIDETIIQNERSIDFSKKNKFVPYSVDNTVKGIKKLHKKILSFAPKKKLRYFVQK